MKRSYGSSGFTLMEVLISLIILGISMSIMLVWHQTSWRSQMRSNRTVVAGHVAERQIETLRILSSADPSWINSINDGHVMNMIDSTVSPPMNVTCRFQVRRDHFNQIIPNVREVILRVAIPTGKTIPDTLTVATCIAKDF